MTRTASEQDLYRRVQALEEALRSNQQGILAGFGVWDFDPVDYVGSTGNVVLTSTFNSIVDVAPGALTLPALGGMRILLVNQTNKIENGIYEVGTDNFLLRSPDMPAGAVVRPGMRVFVRNGDIYGNSIHAVSGGREVAIGSNDLVYVDQSSQRTGRFRVHAANAYTFANGTRVTFHSPSTGFPSPWWDTSNQWFMPKVAGFYFVGWVVTLAHTLATTNYLFTYLMKTGFAHTEGVIQPGSTAVNSRSGGTALVYLNGSTDYIAVVASNAALANLTIHGDSTQAATSFWGARVGS
jgi:hypothetical protein